MIKYNLAEIEEIVNKKVYKIDRNRDLLFFRHKVRWIEKYEKVEKVGWNFGYDRR